MGFVQIFLYLALEHLFLNYLLAFMGRMQAWP
jgi:hypothetical protein